VAALEYKLIRTRKLASGISISVSPEKGVIVRAPIWTPMWSINMFLEEKQSWILSHLNKFKEKFPKKEKRYVEGEKHLFFGNEYTLAIQKSPTPGRAMVTIDESNLRVSVYSEINEETRATEIKKAILSWYMENGVSHITERTNYYSSLIGVDYGRITLKEVSSIWGSCSVGNNLTFNRKLILAPKEVVDYVIIHEVSHLVHRNHSSRFWGLVYKHDPNFKMHRKWLRDNHHILSI